MSKLLSAAAALACVFVAGCQDKDDTSMTNQEKANFAGKMPPPDVLAKLNAKTPTPHIDRKP